MLCTKLNSRYQQSYMIQNPVSGAMVLFAFYFVFAWIYQPFNTQRSQSFNFEITMILYAAGASLCAWLTVVVLKKNSFFSRIEEWTLLKELISIYLVLQLAGIAIFLLAFLIEGPVEFTRWDIKTFLDSCKYSFLIGIFPYTFFALLNLETWIEKSGDRVSQNEYFDRSIEIRSSLKKESLHFRVKDFLFATSDGNYVVFYILENENVVEKTIRNSITNIQGQLNSYPRLFRCHRAFIVNMDKVLVSKGNASGYQLSIQNTDKKVPVSRQRVQDYNTFRTNSN